MSKPNCFKCKYNGSIPGSAHRCCKHPDLKGIWVLSLTGKFSGAIGPIDIIDGFNIEANQHGINNGWFNWPFNFDPTWLENCDKCSEPEKISKNDKAKELCNLGICRSMGEARRIVNNNMDEKLKTLWKKKNATSR